MAERMSAREAWEIVKAGEPTVVVHFMRDGIYESTEDAYKATKARYARARAIVEALVHAHEGLGELSDYCVPIRTAKVRALERGDEIPKVTTRGETGE